MKKITANTITVNLDRLGLLSAYQVLDLQDAGINVLVEQKPGKTDFRIISPKSFEQEVSWDKLCKLSSSFKIEITFDGINIKEKW